MPPVLSSIIAIPLIVVIELTLGSKNSCGFISGFIVGYLCYDLIHYYLHHNKPKFEYFNQLKIYHMNHHYKNEMKQRLNNFHHQKNLVA